MIKSESMQVENLRTRVGGPKYIIKNILIFDITQRKYKKLWESV